MSKLGEISEFDETLFEREIDGEEIPVVELKDDGYDSSIFDPNARLKEALKKNYKESN